MAIYYASSFVFAFTVYHWSSLEKYQKITSYMRGSFLTGSVLAAIIGEVYVC